MPNGEPSARPPARNVPPFFSSVWQVTQPPRRSTYSPRAGSPVSGDLGRRAAPGHEQPRRDRDQHDHAERDHQRMRPPIGGVRRADIHVQHSPRGRVGRGSAASSRAAVGRVLRPNASAASEWTRSQAAIVVRIKLLSRSETEQFSPPCGAKLLVAPRRARHHRGSSSPLRLRSQPRPNWIPSRPLRLAALPNPSPNSLDFVANNSVSTLVVFPTSPCGDHLSDPEHELVVVIEGIVQIGCVLGGISCWRECRAVAAGKAETREAGSCAGFGRERPDPAKALRSKAIPQERPPHMNKLPSPHGESCRGAEKSSGSVPPSA